MKKSKAKKIILIVLVVLLVLLAAALLPQVGFGGRYTDQDGKYVHVTGSTSFAHIYNHPLWEGNGKNLYSIWGNQPVCDLTSFMSVKALCYWCSWNADSAIEGLNALIDAANEKRIEIWNVYPDEDIAADPHFGAVQAVYYHGQPGMPVAIVAAGGGYQNVASLEEGFPYAAALNQAGYPVFVLKYRVGEDLIPAEDVANRINPKISEASKDMQALLRLIDSRKEELGLTMEDYTLWGSSAGGGLINAFAFDYEGPSFEELGLPRPAALFMIYTHAKYIDLFQFTSDDLPVFTIVGEGDAYGGDVVMDRVVPRMQEAGMDVVYHHYQHFPHGSGLGKGTDAEGWINEAMIFWQDHMNNKDEVKQ